MGIFDNAFFTHQANFLPIKINIALRVDDMAFEILGLLTESDRCQQAQDECEAKSEFLHDRDGLHW